MRQRTAAQRAWHSADEKARRLRWTPEQREHRKATAAARYQARKKPYVPKGDVYRKDGIPLLERETAIYLAGLFDGEGAFMISTSTTRTGAVKYSSRIRIAMSHKETIAWVAAKLNRPVQIHGLGRNAPANAKRIYRVSIENVAAVIGLCEQLLPFLITKKEAAETTLAFARSRSGQSRLGGTGRAYTDTEAMLVARLKQINRFGNAPEQKVAV